MRTGLGLCLGAGVVGLVVSSGCAGLRETLPAVSGQQLIEPPAQLLWPEGKLKSTGPAETVTNRDHDQNDLGLNRSIGHVSTPTYSLYMPADMPAEGATALVVCPGGGFRRIVIDKEGHDVARWLNRHGIVGAVLKYRTGAMGEMACLEDARRMIRMLRAQAAELGIDPDRIGIIGFSAGGHLALRTALHYEDADPSSEDALQRVSSRPDFAAMVYSAVPQDMGKHVDGQTPPAFFVHSYDDGVPIEGSLSCYQAWKRAGVPAEAHFYAVGGHGFGLGVKGGPVTSWPDRCIDWLASLRFLGSE